MLKEDLIWQQNYGAPKITVEWWRIGEVISERSVGAYMRQMGICAQWSKPWTITTKDSDFSTELQNILDEQFNPASLLTASNCTRLKFGL